VSERGFDRRIHLRRNRPTSAPIAPVSLTEHQSGSYVGQATDAAPAVWDVELDADHGAEREFRSENCVILE
jgi:nitrogen fixation protein FixH